MTAYSAAKSMLLSVGRSLAELTKGTRVTANSVIAGTTAHREGGGYVGPAFPGPVGGRGPTAGEGAEGMRSTSLIQRFIRPQEIADLVAYVSSPRAGAINGSALRIEGGCCHSRSDGDSQGLPFAGFSGRFDGYRAPSQPVSVPPR